MNDVLIIQFSILLCLIVDPLCTIIITVPNFAIVIFFLAIREIAPGEQYPNMGQMTLTFMVQLLWERNSCLQNVISLGLE